MKSEYYIRKDERWPILELAIGEASTFCGIIFLSDDEYKNYKKVMEKFRKWQDRISMCVT